VKHFRFLHNLSKNNSRLRLNLVIEGLDGVEGAILGAFPGEAIRFAWAGCTCLKRD
jgi:hypothetical protein